MPTQGCGDGRSACTPSLQEEHDYNYFQQSNEEQQCQAGQDIYCNNFELKLRNPEKPITSANVSYSGQAGYAAEGGISDQWSATMDWVEGNLYITQTVGAYFYGGTPTGLGGEVGVGLSLLHGIPVKQQDIGPILEGKNLDYGGEIGANVFGQVNLSVGRSDSLIDSGQGINRLYFPGSGYVFSENLMANFGADAIPTGIEGGVLVGRSQTFVIREISLW